MSHFTVLVIGDDVEKQLAPYHEFECTGTNDEYVQDVDITDKVREESKQEDGSFDIHEGLEYYGLEDKIVFDEENIDKKGKHEYGYALFKGDELVRAIDRTNPNSKWDWWQVGGRWTGFFRLKDGKDGDIGSPSLVCPKVVEKGFADSAMKKDIDFEAMKKEASEKASARWDKALSLMGDSLLGFTPWEDVRDVHCKGDIEAARKAYHDQEAYKLLSAEKDFRWGAKPEDFAGEKNAYLKKAENNAIATFAVVKDGVWYEKVEMGWWACVSNEKDDWHKEFYDILDSIPDDTLLTVVDCHI